MVRAARVVGSIASALVLTSIAAIQAPRVHAQSAASRATSIASPRLVVDLPLASERDRERVRSSAREATDRLTEWLGPCPATAMTFVNRSGQDSHSSAGTTVTLDLPWRSAPETMDVESQVVFGMARQWWRKIGANAETTTLVDGLAWYLQSRIVDRLFDFNFLVPAHSAAGVRTFGDVWPRAFLTLPLDRSTGGLGREEYLRSRLMPAASWPTPGRRLAANLTIAGLRHALAFATLEQLVGWPTLQGALRVLTQSAAERALSRQDVEQLIASAVGQDLSWFFLDAFDASKTYDYSVRELTTGEAAPCGAGLCFKTNVLVAREGPAEFTGGANPTSTSFESGDAMELRVTFADGQRVSTRWDGRAAARTFQFDSVSPAVSAVVDPDHILMLDENVLNNAKHTSGRAAVVVQKWVAYWMVWLEGAVLDYGMLF